MAPYSGGGDVGCIAPPVNIALSLLPFDVIYAGLLLVLQGQVRGDRNRLCCVGHLPSSHASPRKTVGRT